MGDIPECPIVKSETYGYTIYGKNGEAIDVTSEASTVREFWDRLFPPAGKVGAVVQRTTDGRHAYFPEAVVLVADLRDGVLEPCVQVEAWIDDDDDGDDPDAAPNDAPDGREPEPEPAPRRPKLARQLQSQTRAGAPVGAEG